MLTSVRKVTNQLSRLNLAKHERVKRKKAQGDALQNLGYFDAKLRLALFASLSHFYREFKLTTN